MREVTLGSLWNQPTQSSQFEQTAKEGGGWWLVGRKASGTSRLVPTGIEGALI